MWTTRSHWAATFFAILFPAAALTQSWDVPARTAAWVEHGAGGALKISAELRGRYEGRSGQAFGRDPDVATALFRNRLGLSYRPVSWLSLSGAVLDSRAPGYGSSAPSTVRDPLDLYEGYFELFPGRKTGFGMTAGRAALAYGETRLIGTANWTNVPRGFDHARAYWRTARGRLDFLWLSPVKIRLGEFNRPVLGERLWGTYNSFPDFIGKHLMEAYFLRHDQNRPGGFAGGSQAAGADRLGVTTFGGRVAGPLPNAVSYSLEGAWQTGHVGAAHHRAAAWFSSLGRRWVVQGKPLDATAEYKYASGTKNPLNASRVNTFDPLFPSIHDKFGHMDLFGWRNLHTFRSLATLGVTKSFTLNFMYDNWWLASARDSLYSTAGRSIAKSADGSAGRHVGQETDIFATYKYRHLTIGAGYGRMFKGEFLRHATPGVEPTYVYLFHTYSL